MPKDVIDFTPDRQTSYTNIESIRAEVAQTLSHTSPYPKQLAPRRDGRLRWIALAVVVGGIVAIAFVNFLAH